MDQSRKKQRLMTPEELSHDVTIHHNPVLNGPLILRPAKVELHRHCRRDDVGLGDTESTKKLRRNHLKHHSRHRSSHSNHFVLRQEASLDTGLASAGVGSNVADAVVSAAMGPGMQQEDTPDAQPPPAEPVDAPTPPANNAIPVIDPARPVEPPPIPDTNPAPPIPPPTVPDAVLDFVAASPPFAQSEAPASTPTPEPSMTDAPTKTQPPSLETNASGALIDPDPANVASTLLLPVSGSTASTASYGNSPVNTLSASASAQSSSPSPLSSGVVSSNASNTTASSSNASSSIATSSSSNLSTTISQSDSGSTPSRSSSISSTPTASSSGFFGIIPATDSLGSATPSSTGPSSTGPSSTGPSSTGQLSTGQSSTTFMTSSRPSSSSSTTVPSLSSTSSFSALSASSMPDSSSISGSGYGNGNSNDATVSAAAVPTGGASHSGSSGSSSVPTPQVVGGVVGGLAGLSILLVAALLFMKWYKKRKAASTNALGAGGASSGGPAEMSQDPRSAAAVAGAVPTDLAAGGFMRKLSRPKEPPAVPAGERGFERISGRKLPSQFSPGMEGPSKGPSTAGSGGATDGSKSSSYPSGGTFLSTGSVENPFTDRAATSSSAPGVPAAGAAAAGGAAARRPDASNPGDKERFMPGPARTPVVHSVENTRSSHLAHLAAPAASGRGITPPPRPSMARSHQSYDSSRNSRFTEEFT